jgi:two-component system, OmpR family, sensor histidine kinase QseC
MSIRRRLIVLFFGGTLVLWVSVNFFLYKGALGEIDDLWDTHLAQSARVLLAFASASAEQGELERLTELLPQLIPASLPQPHKFHGQSGADAGEYERSFTFQLHTRDGSFRLHSQDAPDEPFADGVPGFSYRVIDGTAWRVFGIADPKNALVLYAGEDHAGRKDLAWHLVEHLVFPSLLALPLLFILIWLAVGQGLKPLALLVKEVKERDPTDLQLLAGSSIPAEVEPLVAALNSLFARLRRALEGERHFTGNAAHELRTPLAALRVQAQVAHRATNDQQRRRALDQIVAGVDQAGRLVDQLLTLARLDAKHDLPAEGRVKLLEVARRTAAELEPLAQQCCVSLQVDGEEDALTPGDETCIGILLRNLIDNAIRYSPTGGEVAVAVRKGDLCNRVIVTDTGPGVTDGQHAEMFERFRRGPEPTALGSGLGLSIVRRICELHRGRVHLENRKEGGLCCEVQLPPLAAAKVGAPQDNTGT